MRKLIASRTLTVAGDRPGRVAVVRAMPAIPVWRASR